VIDEKREGESGRDYHQITIEDNGIGFEQDDAIRIFMMFEKLHQKVYAGSGVGLAACKKIMNVHEGFLVAEGEPGTGARFHCYFPVKKEV
jgi:light-regulated signal transduction histidine kinase (bacteriophytochrome)